MQYVVDDTFILQNERKPQRWLLRLNGMPSPARTETWSLRYNFGERKAGHSTSTARLVGSTECSKGNVLFEASRLRRIG